jgi:hypothetical protein
MGNVHLSKILLVDADKQPEEKRLIGPDDGAERVVKLVSPGIDFL